MKRVSLLLAAAVLALCLSGCWQKEPEPDPPAPPVEEQPVALEELRVELTRGDLDADRLAAAVQELPGLLKDLFSKTEIEVGKITLTVSTSPAATAQALAEGSVDLAFLPADIYLLYDSGAKALFADAYDVDGSYVRAGTRALICAAPTAYGGRLDERAASGKPLSWSELDHARWGVLEEASLGGYRCFDLWLADHYGGNRLEDLSDVTVYDSYEALFRAAAAGEIDALAIRDDARTEVAEVWTLNADKTARGGMRGFERGEGIWVEVPVLDVTDFLYSTVAAVSPELAEGAFSAALEKVLLDMSEDAPEEMLVLGAARFAPVEEEQLNPQRRLLAMEE